MRRKIGKGLAFVAGFLVLFCVYNFIGSAVEADENEGGVSATTDRQLYAGTPMEKNMNLISEIKDGKYEGIRKPANKGYNIYWSILNIDGKKWRVLDKYTSEYCEEKSVLVQSVYGIPGCTVDNFKDYSDYKINIK